MRVIVSLDEDRVNYLSVSKLETSDKTSLNLPIYKTYFSERRQFLAEILCSYGWSSSII